MSEPAGRPAASTLPVGLLAAVACAAFGGPLALAALYGPAAVQDAPSSAGVAAIVAAVVFVAPLSIWLRYGRDIASAGGLSAFVEAAAGRRVALAHAAVWTGSYLLYLIYTSAYVVYDLLPSVWPGVHAWRPSLLVLLPVALAAVVVAGQRVALTAIGAVGVAQFVLVALVDAVAVRHAPTAAAFAPLGSATRLRAAGGIATLFVCGSLPLFLGGEIAAARAAFRRVLPPVFLLTALGVLLAVYPLARDPAFTHAAIPGAALTAVDIGHAAGVVVGAGTAASVLALVVLELVALSRLAHYAVGSDLRRGTRWLAAILVISGPVSLAIGPDRFYDMLLRPSLILLWLAQLVVIAVFPHYIRRRARLRAWHIAATAVALAVTGFGLVTSAANIGAT